MRRKGSITPSDASLEPVRCERPALPSLGFLRGQTGMTGAPSSWTLQGGENHAMRGNAGKRVTRGAYVATSRPRRRDRPRPGGVRARAPALPSEHNRR